VNLQPAQALEDLGASRSLLFKQLPFAIRAAVLARSRRPGLRLAFCLGDDGNRPATPVTLLSRIERRNGALYMNRISGAVVVPVKRFSVLLRVQGRSCGTVELLQIALFHITDRRVHQEAEVGCVRVGIGDPSATGEDKVDLDALQRISDITGGCAFHALGDPQELADVYTTLDKMTPEKVKREIYRPQRDFFWIPLAIALSILTLYHCLALLVAVLRAPGRKQGPKTMEIDGASHGN
jgi:hypothetical protein